MGECSLCWPCNPTSLLSADGHNHVSQAAKREHIWGPNDKLQTSNKWPLLQFMGIWSKVIFGWSHVVCFCLSLCLSVCLSHYSPDSQTGSLFACQYVFLPVSLPPFSNVTKSAYLYLNIKCSWSTLIHWCILVLSWVLWMGQCSPKW